MPQDHASAAHRNSRQPGATSSSGDRPSRYRGRDGAIVGRNQGRLFNRPLYIAHTNAFVLAGDGPVARFASGETLHGTFFLGVIRGRTTKWLHTFDDITMEYRPAHVRWIARDRACRDLAVTLEIVALEHEVGWAARLTTTGAESRDRLVWAYGGAKTWPDKPLNWELDPHRTPLLVPAWFDPALCADNTAHVDASGFTLAGANAPKHVTLGRSDARGATKRCDAAHFKNPAALIASAPDEQPMLAGVVDLATQASTHWEFLRVDENAVAGGRKKIPSASRPTLPEVFAAGLARSSALASRLVVETPDARLDAAAAVFPAAKDGMWYPPVFRHGAMLWNVPYPGWRTLFGATAVGWHERVKAQANYYLGHQVTAAKNRSTQADPKLLFTVPAKNSRFYGRGRIVQDQGIYNMQSQFFDQLIHAWRWTGDAELAAVLRPALELHLEWLRDCFDPDGDGLYESFINVWPTDSVWYSGGGATEETSYAYRAHAAARALAQRARDSSAVKRHTKQLAHIRRAFRKKLWVSAKGHAGLYREQDGLRRLHEDAWLYSIFLPIDAGLVGATEAAASLRYTEASLQNDRMPCGGRQVWTSNLVPGIWSVRERWAGDNHHLALAYFQVGLAEDGWDIFRGTFLHTAFDHRVPGDFGAPEGGTDFGDSTDMFGRTLIEGLFGYAPDRPRGLVRIAPQLPAEWKHARLRTPEVELRYRREGEVTSLAIELTEAARLDIQLPVCARGIAGVTADRRPVRWTTQPGFGRTLLRVRLSARRRVTIELTTKNSAAVIAPVILAGKPGKRVVMRSPTGPLQAFSDPQGVLADAAIRGGAIVGRLTGNTGSHTVTAHGRFGGLPQITRFQIEIAGQPEAAIGPVRAGAKWRCVDLAPVLNGDIRTIYAQHYLSPRPATISARIGSDGYSPWTFLYWNSHPPASKLDSVPTLLKDDRLCTPQGVPFAWPGEARNIAFTSRWDNWPRRVTVPVNQAGRRIWFLVCGSTNPMQGRIANAVLRLRYADGVVDALELVPPFNYWNLSPIRPVITAPGQESRCDYTAEADAFCVPKPWPQTVQLGENCRAMLLDRRLRRGSVLQSVTLETLSPEVVVGLMGVTIEAR